MKTLLLVILAFSSLFLTGCENDDYEFVGRWIWEADHSFQLIINEDGDGIWLGVNNGFTWFTHSEYFVIQYIDNDRYTGKFNLEVIGNTMQITRVDGEFAGMVWIYYREGYEPDTPQTPTNMGLSELEQWDIISEEFLMFHDIVNDLLIDYDLLEYMSALIVAYDEFVNIDVAVNLGEMTITDAVDEIITIVQDLSELLDMLYEVYDL